MSNLGWPFATPMNLAEFGAPGEHSMQHAHIMQCEAISEKMRCKIGEQYVNSEDVEELKEMARYMRKTVKIIEECNPSREVIQEIDG